MDPRPRNIYFHAFVPGGGRGADHDKRADSLAAAGYAGADALTTTMSEGDTRWTNTQIVRRFQDSPNFGEARKHLALLIGPPARIDSSVP